MIAASRALAARELVRLGYAADAAANAVLPAGHPSRVYLTARLESRGPLERACSRPLRDGDHIVLWPAYVLFVVVVLTLAIAFDVIHIEFHRLT